MKTRVISIVITLCILCTSFPMFSLAKTSVNTTDYEQFDIQQNFFKKLGIIEKNESFDADTGITRARFAKIVSDIIGVSVSSEDYKDVFSDVNEQTLYADAIYSLYSLRIISGNGSEFNPDDSIAYNEALHILLNVLNYGDYVKNNGGFPHGDYIVANKIDLDIDDNALSSNKQIFNLLYECLKTRMLDIVSITNSSFDYNNRGTETMLERYFNIRYQEGVLQSDGITSINKAFEPDKGYAVIDNEQYSVNFDYDQMVGTYVDYYFTDYDTSSKKLFFITESSSNVSLEINADDILDYSNRKYTYRVNAKDKKITLKTDATVIYNGEIMTSYDKDHMIPHDGSIMFIDSNNDGVYEIVNIMSYTSFVIKEISDSKDYITIYANKDMNIMPIRILKDDQLRNVFRNSKGIIDYSSIKKDTVISAYCVQGDGDYQICHRAVISSDTITGDIEYVEEKSNDIYYTINDSSYKVAYTYLDKAKTAIKPKGNVTFGLNFENKIVDLMSVSTGDMAYGYLINAAVEDDSFNKKTLKLKVFSELGKVIVYDVADKVTVDGVKISDNVNSIIYGKLTDGSGSIKNQLFRYDVNSDKEIVKLDLCELVSESSTVELNNRLFMQIEPTSLYYKKTKKSFLGRIKLKNSTMIIKIPNNLDDAVDSDFAICTPDDITMDGRYIAEAYSLDNNAIASDVVVLKYNYAEFPVESRPCVVKKVRDCKSNSGEISKSIVVDGESGELRLVAKSADVLTMAKSISTSDLNTYNVQQGDVINYVLNTDGEIECVHVIYKYDTDTLLSSIQASTSSFYNNNRVVRGYVYNIDGEFISFAFDATALSTPGAVISQKECEIYDFDDFNVIVADNTKSRLTFESGTINDLQAYCFAGQATEVILCTDGGVGKLLLILRR